jgi:hypothetical protein
MSEIGVVHSAELLGDGKQSLGPQANNVVFCVVVGQRHLGSAYLRTLPSRIVPCWEPCAMDV